MHPGQGISSMQQGLFHFVWITKWIFGPCHTLSYKEVGPKQSQQWLDEVGQVSPLTA